MTGEIAQRREISHAVSAQEIFHENLVVDRGLRGFLTARLTACHFVQVVKEFNNRP